VSVVSQKGVLSHFRIFSFLFILLLLLQVLEQKLHLFPLSFYSKELSTPPPLFYYILHVRHSDNISNYIYININKYACSVLDGCQTHPLLRSAAAAKQKSVYIPSFFVLSFPLKKSSHNIFCSAALVLLWIECSFHVG
jgi:hypothetical protein